MKTIILTIVIFAFLLLNQLFSQDEKLHTREITFVNNSATNGGNRSLTVRVHPVSMVFQGRPNLQTPSKYNLIARISEIDTFNYISGRGDPGLLSYFTIPPHPPGAPFNIGFNFDSEGRSSGNVASMGIGIYKMEFWWSGNPATEPPNDTCYIEFDPGPLYNPRLSCCLRY